MPGLRRHRLPLQVLLVDALDEADPGDSSDASVLRALDNPLLCFLRDMVAGRLVHADLPVGAVRVVATSRWVALTRPSSLPSWRCNDGVIDRG